jgi:hypothetical protein
MGLSIPALLAATCLASTAGQDPKTGKSRPAKEVESVFGLDIPLPEGWTRNDEPEGGVTLVPPRAKETPLDPPQYLILLFPPRPLRGTLGETQRSTFDELAKGLLKDAVPPKHEPSVPGPFIRTSTAGKDATNWTQTLRLNGVLTEAGYVALVTYGSENSRTIGTILNGVIVKNPPKAASRPKIVEAYRRLAQQTVAETHAGQQLLTAVPYDRLWLRADGVADLTPLYLEGHAASPLPPKIDAKMVQGFYGAWTASGGQEIHVTAPPTSRPRCIVARRASFDSAIRSGSRWRPSTASSSTAAGIFRAPRGRAGSSSPRRAASRMTGCWRTWATCRCRRGPAATSSGWPSRPRAAKVATRSATSRSNSRMTTASPGAPTFRSKGTTRRILRSF